MRNHITQFLLIYAFTFIASNVNAQNNSQINAKNPKELTQMFSLLDKSKIPTGILYDQVMPFSKIGNHNGKNTTVSCSKSNWKQMYFELQKASFSRDTIKYPAVNNVLEKTVYTDTKIIQLYLLNFEYAKIKENALENGLISIQNNKVISQQANQTLLYDKKRAFAIAPHRDYTYYANNFSFILKAENVFTNIDGEITGYYIDLGDGMGEEEIQLNQLINVSYSGEGVKSIMLSAETVNGKLSSSFEIRYSVLDAPAHETISVTAPQTIWKWGCIEHGDHGECLEEGWYIDETQYFKDYLYCVKSPKTTEKRSSVIIAEGFDTSNSMFFDELWEIFNRQNAAKALLDNDYDVYLLNYHNPTQSIFINANVFERALNKVKERQVTKNEIIVIGGSMGGLVTRTALLQMEEGGRDTQTRLWISFDSPQKGANIPLGLQYFLKSLAENNVDAADQLEKINSPAAKQMLLYHHTAGQTVALERRVFTSFLENRGMPITCRNIAVANGASDGTGQGYEGGDEILELEATKWGITMQHLTAWAVPATTVFDFSSVTEDDYSISAENTNSIDAAPGGFRSTMQTFEDESPSSVTIDGVTVELTMTAHHSNHAFIPTISALGLDVSDYYHNIIGDNNLLSKTEFDELYFPDRLTKSTNQKHVWVSYQTANNVLDELMPETLKITGENWQQGEIVAKTRIHFKMGFSASASDELHAYLGNIDKSMLEIEFEQSRRRANNKSLKNKNIKDLALNVSNSISIFPNPTTGKFSIKNAGGNQNVQVSDLTGKIISVLTNKNKTNETLIDISSAPAGIYILRIQSGTNVLISKIIKR